MIIDFKTNFAKASCYDVIDALTGENINGLGIFYADDEAGLIRRHVRDPDGDGRTFLVNDEGTGAVIVEESRPIVIALKESHRGAIRLPEGWLASRKGPP